MRRDGGGCPARVALTVDQAVPFKVLALEDDVAGAAGEAFGVEFAAVGGAAALSFVGFEVVALDTGVAGAT